MAKQKEDCPIVNSIRNGDIKNVLKYIAQKKSVNKQEEETGSTALQLAVTKRDINLVKLLMCAGARDTVNQPNFQKLSPMKTVASFGDVEMLELLLIGGGRVYIKSEKTWLRTTVKVNEDVGMKNLLQFAEKIHSLKKGSSSKQDWEQLNEFHQLIFTIGQGKILKLREMILNGSADVNYRPFTQAPTSLHFAVESENLQVLKMILISVKESLINMVDNSGNSPLFLAIRKNNPHMVELLVIAGATVNLADSTGRTPLEYTIDHCNSEVAKILVLAGANIESRGIQGHTALHLAAKFNDTSLLVDLLRRGVPVDVRDNMELTPLHYAIKFCFGASHYELIEKLLENYADLNALDSEGRTPENYFDQGPVSDQIKELFAFHKMLRQHRKSV